MLRHPEILVTGGAGYVGSVLVPKLLDRGHRVRVLDSYLFGPGPLDAVRGHPGLLEIRGDIRDQQLVGQASDGVDAVIHLACISNDPSCELDPELTQAVNYDCFEPLVAACHAGGAKRFIFASSSSVYGISDSPDVTEEHDRRPITAYNTLKARCEDVLFRYQSPEFTTVSVRPATLCGVAPRQRLDLTVNILTIHALERGEITVFGGAQMRPNLHVQDMAALYELLLDVPSEPIAGQAFNVAWRNYRVSDIAEIVRDTLAREFPSLEPIRIVTTESDDPRSYHVSMGKLERTLGFSPRHGIEDAVVELAKAWQAGAWPGGLAEDRYFNVRHMTSMGAGTGTAS